MGGYRLGILHLSDLHERVALDWMDADRRARIRLRAASRQRVLGESFRETLKGIRAAGEVHLICFTGDVADFGLPEEYAAATPRVKEILNTVGVPPERFFVVPGNHDVDRRTYKPAWRRVRERALTDARCVSDWLHGDTAPPGTTNATRDKVLERCSAFWQWLCDDMGRGSLRPSMSRHRRLGYRATLEDLGLPFPVHIIGLDSAWLCGDDDDQGKLALATGQVDLLTTDESGEPLAGFRLAMMHHPLTDLIDGAHSRRLLAGTVDIVLRGHQHEEGAEEWEDPDHKLRILAAGSLYEGDRGDRWVNGFHVLEVVLDDAGRPRDYNIEFRGWSPNGFWHRDNAVYKEARDGRLRWSVTPETDADVEHPAPKRAFVGRDAELRALQEALLPNEGEPRAAVVCNLQGMAGVGKTWLVEQLCAVHHDALPGRRLPLVLRRDEETSVEALLGRLADELRLAGSPGDLRRSVPEALRAGGALVHLDNVDSRGLADVAAELVDALPGTPVVVGGRYAGFQETGRWQCIPVMPFELAQGLEQLAAELDPDTAQRTPDGDRVRLVGALGGLPLAIHLAAGWLKAGYDVDRFLALMRKKKLSIEPFSPSDSDYRDRADRAQNATFDLSLAAFRESPGMERRVPELCALGEGPRAGFGLSLGASLAGVDEDDTLDLVVRAVELSLVERVPAAERPDRAWRVHPLLAEHLRNRLDDERRDAARDRLGVWFLKRIAEGDEETRAARWAEVDREGEGLVEWLAALTTEESRGVARAGYVLALAHGPYHAWMAAASRGLECDPAYAWQSNLLWVLGNLGFRAGDLDRALACAERKERLERTEGEDWGLARALGLRADILYRRGELDEALRIRREEEPPVYERLRDVRWRAHAMGRIADILYQTGELDEALRIRREEELPVYERLGDVFSRALTMGRIADILQARGELDEALRIRREEELPIYERLGDVRELPVGRAKLAITLLKREATGDREEAIPLLHMALDAARQLRLPRECERIEDTLRSLGEDV